MSPEQLLGLADVEGTTVVADLEAGIGTLTRLAEGALDALVVVVEPTAKSIDVAARAVAVGRAKGVERVEVVANKVRDEADVDAVRRGLPGETLVVVPADEGVEQAERRGEAPLDAAGHSPAVRALVSLAGRLRER